MDSPVKLFCYITSPPVSSLETLISDPILARVLRGREEVWNWSGWPRVSQLSPAKVMGCVMKNEMSKHQDSTSDQKQPWGIYKECILALAGVAQLIGHRPANRKVTGSIPGLWVWSRLWCVWKAANWCFSPSLSPFLPLSLIPISMCSGES